MDLTYHIHKVYVEPRRPLLEQSSTDRFTPDLRLRWRVEVV
jgi:hypothetical protein